MEQSLIPKIPLDRQFKIKQVACSMFQKVDKQELAYLTSWLLTLFGLRYQNQGKIETYEMLWDAAAQLDGCEHCTGDPMDHTKAVNKWTNQ